MIIHDVNEEYFSKKSNGYLYHYTSPDALINIIEKSSLRFTDIEYLNDKDEFTYIFKLVKEISRDRLDEVSNYISEMSKDLTPDNIGYILTQNAKRSGFYGIEEGKYYVLSGTEVDDSLPMWVYYAKNGRYAGYSIKMDIKKLASAFKDVEGEFLYGSVIYDKKTQISIIKQLTLEILNRLKEKLADSKDDEPYISNAQGDFWTMINAVRLFFKREKFSHEKETRIVLLAKPKKECRPEEDGKPETDSKIILKHQSVNGVIKPYIEYKFPDKVLPIVSITISPSIESTIGKKGLKSLLMNNGYKNSDYLCSVKMKKSKINLRY